MKFLRVIAYMTLAAILFSCVGCSSNSDSGSSAQQGPDIEWSKTFGGDGYDAGYSVQQTSDGGFIIVGVTRSVSTGDTDVYIIKTDVLGNEQWSKTFGSDGYDAGYSVQQTSDGGFIIVGVTESFGAGDNDVYLIKTDMLGNEQWSKTFGGSGSDDGYSVQQTNDDGFVIVGVTEAFGAGDDDIYLIKTDVSGNEQWSKTFGGSGFDSGSSLQQTTDGGFVVLGFMESSDDGSYDVFLIKTDAAGNELWSKMFGDSGFDNWGHSLQQTSDGGFIMVGGEDPVESDECDIYLIKADAAGNEVWSKTLSSSAYDVGYSVQQTIDGGFIIFGITVPDGFGDSYMCMIKADVSGNEVWRKTFDSSGPGAENSVQQTSDGGYIAVGYSRSNNDVYLVKISGE